MLSGPTHHIKLQLSLLYHVFYALYNYANISLHYYWPLPILTANPTHSNILLNQISISTFYLWTIILSYKYKYYPTERV